MLTVIDVGCADHGGDQSIMPLIEEFTPDQLIGLDPILDRNEEYHVMVGDRRTEVVLRRAAGWVKKENVDFVRAGLGSHVTTTREHNRRQVRGVDLRQTVRNALQNDGQVILKLDAEMSEYEILPALMAADLDDKIMLTLVEWHCPECRHGEWSHAPGCEAPPNVLRDSIKRDWRGDMREWDR